MRRKQTTFQRLVNWIASFRRVDGIELPNEGRSSVENARGGVLSNLAIGSVIPEIDFETLRALKRAWKCNPDFSQYVANIVNLGNTGHTLTIDAATEQRAEVALERLNEAAARIYVNGAGVDGLINAYLAQIAWSGALSSEDVVDFPRRQVEQVALVPVEQIHFRFIDGRYVPHQQPGLLFNAGRNPLGLIPLNENTYHYYALQTIENSPYARPPAIAALSIIEGAQNDALENISWIVKKLGILGLVVVNLVKPKVKPNETDQEYKKRAEAYLKSVREVLDGNFKKGLLVAFNDQKFDHANVASDARGAYEVFRVIEEQVFSGLNSIPAFFGRTDSSTETYADVMYNFMLAQTGNVQRLTKRRQEQTYRLDLLLAGIQVDAISLAFNKAHARNPLQETQADGQRIDNALKKARAGIISPDEAAQELGYESAFDPELLAVQPAVAEELSTPGSRAKRRDSFTATFRFDRFAQRYRFLPSRIELAGGSIGAEDDRIARLEDFKKKAAAA